MQVIYSNVSLFPVAEDGTMAESGSVALDPKTGGVRALVGRVNSAEGCNIWVTSIGVLDFCAYIFAKGNAKIVST